MENHPQYPASAKARLFHAPDPSAQARAGRQGFWYEAFVPGEIASLELSFPAVLADALAQVDYAARDLQRRAYVPGLDGLAVPLLRAEAVASSFIEGLAVSQKRLAKAAFAMPGKPDETALSVLGNVRAMEEAVRIGSSAYEVRAGDLLGMHRVLLEGTWADGLAGKLREEQGWIGSASLARAAYVSPPWEEVPRLLADLCAFVNRDDIPPLAQAAIAHAQYETIHPHADGNGRTGRCLIHVILRRHGLASNFALPVSAALAADADRYVAGLVEYREGLVYDWVGQFCQAVRDAADHAAQLADGMSAAQSEWLERLGNPRGDSTARQLVSYLMAHPVVDVASVASGLGVSDDSSRRALSSFEAAGVLSPLKATRYAQAWAADGVFALMERFEGRNLDGDDLEFPVKLPGRRTSTFQGEGF